MNKQELENVSDEQLVNLFNQGSSSQEKLQYFSKIQDDNYKMQILSAIPEKEKYKFIGKLKSSQNIAIALNSLSDETTKKKTFNYIAKQLKGNNIGLLEILTRINFNVTIPANMLTFKLNNINALNLDFLIDIQKHAENYAEIRFKINEDDDSHDIEYSFAELSAIITKIQEVTADIPKDMDEANKFYIIYSRITKMMTYDYNCIRKSDNAERRMQRFEKNYTYEDYKKDIKDIRKSPAGLYGGLVDGKAICAGYALILHEALKYVGIKSQYVHGWIIGGDGHAWNQVQIDGKWYNADPTWDSAQFQRLGKYGYMLLNDEEFDKSHGKFSQRRTKTYRQCKSKFDYSKIQGLSINQIEGKEPYSI